MNPDKINQLRQAFEDVADSYQDIECWYARDLQQLLDYSEWRNFSKVIEKAVEACKNSQQDPENHFVGVNKMVQLGSGSEREVQDVMLTRYACYLIAQNGDPRKEPVAFAQSYFALQTRKQELIEERIALNERLKARRRLRQSETQLSQNIYERQVDDLGFGRIRSKGDAALFGGTTTQGMKIKLGVPKGRPLADFLPTITVNAKALAADITNFNTQQNDLQGEQDITDEHIKNNSDVRALLDKSGIRPENPHPKKTSKSSNAGLMRRIGRWGRS